MKQRTFNKIQSRRRRARWRWVKRQIDSHRWCVTGARVSLKAIKLWEERHRSEFGRPKVKR